MQVILEVAIGLVLTIAVMAVIVSSTMELIAAFTRMRARALEKGVARLLDNQRSVPKGILGWFGLRKPEASTAATQAVMQHPLVQALSSPRATDRPPSYIDAITFGSAVLGTGLPASTLIAKVLDPAAVAAKLAQATPNDDTAATVDAVKAAWTASGQDVVKTIDALLVDADHGQAGIAWLIDAATVPARLTNLATSGDVGASILADAWSNSRGDKQAFVAAVQGADLLSAAKKGVRGVESALAQIAEANPYLGTSLQTLWARAGTDFTKFRKEIEDWFDREMARVSGWYSRWAQWIMVAVALVIVGALNVSAVTVGKTLWNDPTLRTETADAAAAIVNSTSTTTAPTTTTTTVASSSSIAPTSTAAVAAPPTTAPAPTASETLAGLSLPIGWNDTAWPGWTPYLILHLLGILMVAIAASFGAPFWFDLLNRLVNLRAGGTPPPTAADQRKTAAGS